MTDPRFDRLENQLSHLFDLTNGVSSEFYHKNHIENKWSIQEHLAHLGRYQEVFSVRINLILKTDTPKLERYKAENDPEFEKWKSLTTEDKQAVMRRQLNALIFSLTIPELNRIGIHPKFGSMTVYEWVEFFLLHENHHAYAIFRLKKEFSEK